VAVAQPKWDEYGGSTIIIDHEDGDYTVYMHLKAVKVNKGFCVKAGDIIGSVGFTGNSACLKVHGILPNLHFAIIRAQNPGLADNAHPISRALKNAKEMPAPGLFENESFDLGIMDPEPILENISGCLR
jgi:murein DD-endopeptidase MepM/ murein hydrolase activator NlpD